MSDGIFAGMRPVAAPVALKGRVLLAARSGSLRRVGGAGRSGVFSRFDLVWAAMLVLLLTCHVLLSVFEAGGSGSIRLRDARSAEQIVAGDRELSAEAGVNAAPMTVEPRSSVGRSRSLSRGLLDEVLWERL